jgi:hypothetical protein
MFPFTRVLPMAMLATHSLTAADIAEPVAPVSISLFCEWVRLPHTAANALLRQHLKSSDAMALHEAVSQLIQNKTAARLDVQSLLANAGTRARVSGTTDKFYATEYDPPQSSQSLSIDGDWNYELGLPACAGSFTALNLGREVEVETGLCETGPRIQFRFAASWNEHLADISFGIGISLYPQPLFYMASISATLRTDPGVWQLAGVFTPPPDKKPGVSPETAPPPKDRVLLFLRATAPGLKPNPPLPPGEPVSHALLAEWIEADIDLVNDLLEAAPDFTSAAGLRASLDGLLANGSAVLVETAYAPCPVGKESRMGSIRSHPVVTEVDPPQVPQTLSLTNRTPVGSPLPRGGVQRPVTTPAFFNSYSMRDLGTVLDVECSPNFESEWVKLSITAELSALAGSDLFGQGLAEVPQPRAQILRCTTALSLKPGVPALAAILDPPVQPGQALPAILSRKLLLFVRIIP